MRNLVWWAALALGGCGGGGEAEVHLTTNELGTFDADFTGTGGTTSQTFTWKSGGKVVEYSMDITAAKGGRVEVALVDGNGEEVDTLSLEAGKGDDSRDGVVTGSTGGDWQVTIALFDFHGDGSVDLGSDEL